MYSTIGGDKEVHKTKTHDHITDKRVFCYSFLLMI